MDQGHAGQHRRPMQGVVPVFVERDFQILAGELHQCRVGCKILGPLIKKESHDELHFLEPLWCGRRRKRLVAGLVSVHHDRGRHIHILVEGVVWLRRRRLVHRQRCRLILHPERRDLVGRRPHALSRRLNRILVLEANVIMRGPPVAVGLKIASEATVRCHAVHALLAAKRHLGLLAVHLG